MQNKLMALSALSMLFLDACAQKKQVLTPSELNKTGELMFVDLPDRDGNKAYFYINTDKNDITAEYMGFKYVDNQPDLVERIMPKQTKMPISKWRGQLLDFQSLPKAEHIKD